jgi:hypothetical protein
MFFATLKKMAFRLVTTLTAIVLYVGAAVLLPDHLRWLQRTIGDLLGLLERNSDIPSQYFRWLEMSGIDAVLIFALFYLLSTFLVMLWWRFVKASWHLLGRGVKALWPFGKRQPAT